MSAAEEIRRELADIAESLDAVDDRRAALFARRLAVWARGKESGMTHVDLAYFSGVSPVTVGQLLARARP